MRPQERRRRQDHRVPACALPISGPSSALAAPALTAPGWGRVGARGLEKSCPGGAGSVALPHLMPQPLTLFSETALLPLCLFFCLCFSALGTDSGGEAGFYLQDSA